MGVEAPSGVGNIGISLGRIGGEGPSLGRFSDVGKIGVPTAEFVREGPVMKSALKDFKVVEQVRSLGEIRFNGPDQTPGTASIPEVFVEAFSPDIKLKKIWDELTHQESPTPEMFHRAFLTAAAVGKSPQAFGWPRADLEYVTSVLQEATQEIEPIKANKGILTTGYSVPRSVPQGVKVHEILEEREKKARKKKDDSFVALEEEIEASKKRFVLDERALRVVIVEISTAVRKAGVLARKLGIKISGPLINRFLPRQHPGNESEAVKGKGSDGSIPERAEAIEKQGEFATEAEAEERSIKEAYKKPPIKVRKEGEGKPVTDEDVYTVYKDHPVKPNLSEMDVSEQLTATKVEVITESRIQDYPDLEAALNPEISPN